MNTQIFHFNKYDLKGRSIIEGHKSSSNFTVNPTLLLLDGPLMLHSPNCVDLSLSFSLSLSKSSALSLIALNANLWTFSSLFT